MLGFLKRFNKFKRFLCLKLILRIMTDNRTEEGANLIQNEEFFNEPQASQESLNTTPANVSSRYKEHSKIFCHKHGLKFLLTVVTCFMIIFASAFGVYFRKWNCITQTSTRLKTRLSTNPFASSHCPLIFSFTDIDNRIDRISVKGQNWTGLYDPHIETILVDYEKSYKSLDISIENCDDNIGFNFFELEIRSLRGQNVRIIDLMNNENCTIMWYAPQTEIDDKNFDLDCWENAKSSRVVPL